MKKHIKFYKILLVCLMLTLGFSSPILADKTTPEGGSGGSDNTSAVDNTVDNGNAVLGAGNASGNNTRGSGDGGSFDGNAQIANETEFLGVANVDGNNVIDDGVVSQSSHTNLTTTVPATIDVVVIGPGSIENGGKVYENNTSFTTRNMTFNITPSEGYQIGEVYWNGVDVTANVENGVLRLSDIESGVLKVIFVAMTDEDNQRENGCGCCDKCNGKCKCKCKNCRCVNTADNESLTRTYHFVLTMLGSVIVFFLTTLGNNVGRRFKEKNRHTKYKRLRI